MHEANNLNHTTGQLLREGEHLAEAAADAVSSTPAVLRQAAANIEAMTRRGVDRAREMGTDLRIQAGRGVDRGVGYVRDEPVKSVLVAAAAGALLTLVIGALATRRRD